MDEVETARQETIRYHEALYGRPAPGAGDWTVRPHRVVVDCVRLVRGPLHAYDLGAGRGRHTLYLARHLPAGSHVTAVDLLPVAGQRLTEDAALAGLADRVDVVTADLESFRFPDDDAGLVIAFSALEHLRSVDAISDLLARARRATRLGGVHVTAVFADRREVTARGVRAALIECPLSSAQARDLLLAAYRGWEIVVDECSPSGVREIRNGEVHVLRADLVTVVARSPSPG